MTNMTTEGVFVWGADAIRPAATVYPKWRENRLDDESPFVADGYVLLRKSALPEEDVKNLQYPGRGHRRAYLEKDAIKSVGAKRIPCALAGYLSDRDLVLDCAIFVTTMGKPRSFVIDLTPALFGLNLKMGTRLDFKPPKGSGLKKPVFYSFAGVNPKDLTPEHILECLKHVKAGQPLDSNHD